VKHLVGSSSDVDRGRVSLADDSVMLVWTSESSSFENRSFGCGKMYGY